MQTRPWDASCCSSVLGVDDHMALWVHLDSRYFSSLRLLESSMNKRQSPRVWLALWRPQPSSKQWIVQGPSSCSLAVSLLEPACLFLLETWKVSEWLSGRTWDLGLNSIPLLSFWLWMKLANLSGLLSGS